jgi:hypothetical protein
MGSLFQFPGGPDDGLGPERRAYVRNRAEARGLENERARQKSMGARLEGELAKFENAGQEVDDLLNAGAQSLLDKLRAGLDPVLSSLGGKAADLDARRAASAHSAEIVRRAIVAVRAEVEIIDAKLADLDAKKGDLIKAVMYEAAGGPLAAERPAAIDTLREVLTRQAALERVLAPERSDYAPPARVVIEIPNLVWTDAPPTEIVLAPGREIKSAMAVLAAFAVALENDPMAPMPEFPAVDPTPDADTLFHELSTTEMAQVTRNATYSTRQRAEPEKPGFAAQVLDAARSAIGL